MNFPRLVGDIGGTNARFAWQEHPRARLIDMATYPCANYASLLDAIKHYLHSHSKPPPRACAIGIANPVVGDRVQMTNHHWSFSISTLQQELALHPFLVLNDFAALALALPCLEPCDLLQVGGSAPVLEAPMGLVGPGTGLGVAGLLMNHDGSVSVPMAGEGGHATLAGVSDLEDEVVRRLRHRFGHASAERALSGPGLVNLYKVLCEIEGVLPQPYTAADVTHAAGAATNAQCVAAEALFFGFLGTVAGNLALMIGARGGIYIGGGIVPRLGQERIAASQFRERFESKGRFRAYLAEIPVFVVNASVSPALIGAARALDGG